MLKNRVLAALLAALLAVVGGVLVYAYVAGAEQRALEGAQNVDVLVVQQVVPAGTAASELGASVAVVPTPAKVVAAGAVTDVATLGNAVTLVELVPGEQLIESRFVDPDDAEETIPADLQQITLPFEAARALGGAVSPGDRVGVFVSLSNATGEPSAQLLRDRVPVTAVQGGFAGAGEAAVEPTAVVTVTLAVSAADARKLVFAVENGSVWLTKQPAELDDTVSGELTREGFSE